MNLQSEQFAAISRLFSSNLIREMARTGRSPLFARLLKESTLGEKLQSSAPVASIFEAAFKVLKREGYRHEYIYKAALTRNILLGKHSLKSASMLCEFRVGDCKADVAILNGTSTVYEIKSERDSLTRLSRQVDAYSTVFASVYVICSSSHAAEVLRTVPSHVGVLQLTRRQNISTVRDAENSPARTLPEAVFDCLRVEEAKSVLNLHGIPLPEVPNTQMSAALRSTFAKMSPDDAQTGMVAVLKASRSLLPLASLVDQVPPSLQSAALSTPMRKSDHLRLIEAVNTRLATAMLWG